MAYSTHVFVKYKPQRHSEPGGRVEIASAVGEYIPLPNVGDIVDCKNVGGAVGGQTTRTGCFRDISPTPGTTVACS